MDRECVAVRHASVPPRCCIDVRLQTSSDTGSHCQPALCTAPRTGHPCRPPHSLLTVNRHTQNLLTYALEVRAACAHCLSSVHINFTNVFSDCGPAVIPQHHPLLAALKALRPTSPHPPPPLPHPSPQASNS